MKISSKWKKLGWKENPDTLPSVKRKTENQIHVIIKSYWNSKLWRAITYHKNGCFIGESHHSTMYKALDYFHERF